MSNLFANVGGQLVDVRVFPIQITRGLHGASLRHAACDLSRAEAEKIGRVIRALAQADRNPEGHDPEEGHGRNDESPVAASSGDAPNTEVSVRNTGDVE